MNICTDIQIYVHVYTSVYTIVAVTIETKQILMKFVLSTFALKSSLKK